MVRDRQDLDLGIAGIPQNLYDGALCELTVFGIDPDLRHDDLPVGSLQRLPSRDHKNRAGRWTNWLHQVLLPAALKNPEDFGSSPPDNTLKAAFEASVSIRPDRHGQSIPLHDVLELPSRQEDIRMPCFIYGKKSIAITVERDGSFQTLELLLSVPIPLELFDQAAFGHIGEHAQESLAFMPPGPQGSPQFSSGMRSRIIPQPVQHLCFGDMRKFTLTGHVLKCDRLSQPRQAKPGCLGSSRAKNRHSAVRDRHSRLPISG
jgi:hypothetical protein